MDRADALSATRRARLARKGVVRGGHGDDDKRLVSVDRGHYRGSERAPLARVEVVAEVIAHRQSRDEADVDLAREPGHNRGIAQGVLVALGPKPVVDVDGMNGVPRAGVTPPAAARYRRRPSGPARPMTCASGPCSSKRSSCGAPSRQFGIRSTIGPARASIDSGPFTSQAIGVSPVTNDELAARIDDAYILSFLVGTVSLVVLEFAVVLTARYTDWSDTMLNRIYTIFNRQPPPHSTAAPAPPQPGRRVRRVLSRRQPRRPVRVIENELGFTALRRRRTHLNWIVFIPGGAESSRALHLAWCRGRASNPHRPEATNPSSLRPCTARNHKSEP